MATIKQVLIGTHNTVMQPHAVSMGIYLNPQNRQLTWSDVEAVGFVYVKVEADPAYPFFLLVDKSQFKDIDTNHAQRVTYWHFEDDAGNQYLEKPVGNGLHIVIGSNLTVAQQTEMERFTVSIKSDIIYGHSKHQRQAQAAFEQGIITDIEFTVLEKWSRLVFSGSRMTDAQIEKGQQINAKVAKSDLYQYKINLEKALSNAVAKKHDVKNALDVAICLIDDRHFSYCIEKDWIKCSYEVVASEV